MALRLEWHGEGTDKGRLFDTETGAEYDFHEVSLKANDRTQAPEIWVRLCDIECDIKIDEPEKLKMKPKKKKAA